MQPTPSTRRTFFRNTVYTLYQAKKTMPSVPATMSSRPVSAFLLSFSCSTNVENATVTTMLSLSIGTTTLARPSRSAL